jgi:hypothetical protein
MNFGLSVIPINGIGEYKEFDMLDDVLAYIVNNKLEQDRFVIRMPHGFWYSVDSDLKYFIEEYKRDVHNER